MSELRKCPECGYQETVPGPRCVCGHRFAAPAPDAQVQPSKQATSKRNVWMALIPGLLTVALTAGVAVPRWFEFNRVAGVIAGGTEGSDSVADRRACVDVYSVTLKTSEFYVPENGFGALWQKNRPRELSTVVQGMVSNRCGESLQRVRIRIDVRDDDGKKGSAWADVGNLANGEAKPFERAWMGRVRSYEIVEIR